MRKIKSLTFMLLLLCSQLLLAQTAIANASNAKADSISKTQKSFENMADSARKMNDVIMADRMRSDGKIYVVVGVLLIILIGLFAYLISIDRKVKRVEKSIEESKK